MGKRRDEPDEPTLELPSFFRRRKRRDEGAAPDSATAEPTEAAPTAPEPERAAEPEPTFEAPAPTRSDGDPETVSLARVEPREPVPPREPAATAPSMPAPEHEPAAPTPAEPGPEPDAAPASTGRRAARKARAPRTRPALSPGAASLLVGAVVGAVGTGLTWAALQGCEALRGTDSCGGPGLLVLVAILTLMVIAGALLLKALRVTEPNATSFLGVGLMTVIVLVALMESLFSAWMFLAVPVLSALSYLAAQWVSTRFVDTEKAPPGVDVR